MKKGKDKNRNDNMGVEAFPFIDAQEAWFWFVQAQQARVDGARYTAGMSLTPRPCEPTDILKILDGLYRNRLLMRDHLLVLRHYGRRQLAPDARRVKEAIAHKLWIEAFDKIEPILIRKKIVHTTKHPKDVLSTSHPNKFWNVGVKVHSNQHVGFR